VETIRLHKISFMKPSPSWLVLTAPVFLLSLWILVRTIGSLVRLTREATVLSVPMVPSQSVSFAEPGTLDLFLEGARGSNLSGLDFDLTDQDGRAVALESGVLRTTVSGLSRVRVKVRSVHLDRDGVFTLSISGLRPGMNPENRVVFARSITRPLVGHVLALVGLGVVLLGSLAGSIVALLPRR
jgi:hypothetical protein